MHMHLTASMTSLISKHTSFSWFIATSLTGSSVKTMRFDLEGLDVFFPYDYLYKEQYEYMLHLKRAIDDKGHVLLEMPTGTGKTVCLISLITSYQYQYPQTGKLIYCTRTVPEMSKCMEEIKRVIEYRTKMIGPDGGKVLALCLSSRRNMCIHPNVLEEGDRDTVDSLCRNMTASWVRSKVLGKDASGAVNANVNINLETGPSTGAGGFELCNFYENYSRDGSNAGTFLRIINASRPLLYVCPYIVI